MPADLEALALSAVALAPYSYTALVGLVPMVMPCTVTGRERSLPVASPSSLLSTAKVMLSPVPIATGVITSSPVDGLYVALT